MNQFWSKNLFIDLKTHEHNVKIKILFAFAKNLKLCRSIIMNIFLICILFINSIFVLFINTNKISTLFKIYRRVTKKIKKRLSKT